MIRIKIEGKNITELWRLKCVKSLRKLPKDNVAVRVETKTSFAVPINAFIGDEIEVESEQSETGRIIRQKR